MKSEGVHISAEITIKSHRAGESQTVYLPGDDGRNGLPILSSDGGRGVLIAIEEEQVHVAYLGSVVATTKLEPGEKMDFRFAGARVRVEAVTVVET